MTPPTCLAYCGPCQADSRCTCTPCREWRRKQEQQYGVVPAQVQHLDERAALLRRCRELEAEAVRVPGLERRIAELEAVVSALKADLDLISADRDMGVLLRERAEKQIAAAKEREWKLMEHLARMGEESTEWRYEYESLAELARCLAENQRAEAIITEERLDLVQRAIGIIERHHRCTSPGWREAREYEGDD